MVSDQFRSLISLLPSLKPGEGFIIGDAVVMPMRTLIDLPPRSPQSGNVDFFELWSRGTGEGDVERIVQRWWRQDRSALATASPADGPHDRRDATATPPPGKPKPTMADAERKLADLAAMLFDSKS